MVDFIGISTALSWIGIIYFLVAIGTAFFFWKMMPSLPTKIIASAFTIALFYFWPVKQHFEQKKAAEAKQAIRDTALARYKQRCENAGIKIHKTVENVDGILLLKVRPEGINRGDQYKLDDPYGSDLGGMGYVETFLRGRDESGRLVSGFGTRSGYQYVEILNEKTQERERYVLKYKEVGKYGNQYVREERKKNPNFSDSIMEYIAVKIENSGDSPRYGVTYVDISTPEDRKAWIAGSSLRVIDLQTNETIAERIGYMIDLGQGNNSGGRAAWLYATNNACPRFEINAFKKHVSGRGSDEQLHQTRDFVEQVLKPKN